MCSSHVTTLVVASQLQAPMRAVANAIRRRSLSCRTISSSERRSETSFDTDTVATISPVSSRTGETLECTSTVELSLRRAS